MSASGNTMTTSTLTLRQQSALHVGPGNGLPHDPLATVLYARACSDPLKGFAVGKLDGVTLGGCPKALTLGAAPGADRSLTENSGSFGGIKSPTGVAVATDGSTYLIDHTRGILKYFDPCDCAFKPLPCMTATPATRTTPGSSSSSASLGSSGTSTSSSSLATSTSPGSSTSSGASASAPPPDPAQLRGFVPLNCLSSPTGLTVSGTSLLVTDPGNHRVVLIRLIGMVPRGALRLGATTGLRKLWSPYGIAADSKHNIYVSDPDHARIDIFGADGRWLKAWEGLGAVTHLTVDCNDVVLAIIEDYTLDASGKPVPRAVEIQDGTPKPLAGGPQDLAERMPRTPIRTDRQGRLTLEHTSCTTAFDLDGYPIPPEKKATTPLYATKGTYQTTALDSRRLGCVWHRVIVAGDLPPNSGIVVQTTTSDIELDANELANLTPDQWDDAGTLRDCPAGIADALVRSPPGRYLWLRLTFSSDGSVTPSIRRIVVEFPRVSLRRYLPGVYGMDPGPADFTDRFTALFDTTLRSIENRIDTLFELFDARTAPAQRLGGDASLPDFLTWLASWIGVPLARQWPEAVRRAMLQAAACLFTRRGTRSGLRELLLTFLGFRRGHQCDASCPVTRCTPKPLNCAAAADPCPAPQPPLILEHYRLRRWLFVGAGRLGNDAVLWGNRIVNRSQLSGATRTGNARLGPLACPPDRQPATRLYSVPDPARDPFFVYAHKFTVFVPARVKTREWQRRGLEQLLALEAPAHTQWNIEYVEPRFRVGVQALIGLDSVIARAPAGLRLNDNQLGHGTVLPPRPGRPARIGMGTRVGETARLA